MSANVFFGVPDEDSIRFFIQLNCGDRVTIAVDKNTKTIGELYSQLQHQLGDNKNEAFFSFNGHNVTAEDELTLEQLAKLKPIILNISLSKITREDVFNALFSINGVEHISGAECYISTSTFESK